MPGNKGVVYEGPGKVEVTHHRLSRIRAQGRAGGQPRQRGPQGPARRDPQGRRDQHLRQRPAHGPRPHHRAPRARPRPRDHRRGRRDRPGRGVHQGRRPRLRAVQHRLRSLPQLQGGQDRHLPERQPGPPGLGVRLRGHGRLGRRPGRVRRWSRTPTGTCSSSRTRTRRWRRSSTWPCSSDIFPTGYHGCVSAGRDSRDRPSTSPAPARSGSPRRASALLLGAAVVIVGDLNKERLEQARSFGCETIDVSQGDPKDQIEQILGEPEVDCGVDAVGFEARGHGADAGDGTPRHRAQLAHGDHPRGWRARHPRPVRDR